MGHGIDPAHAAQVVAGNAGQRQTDVDAPEALGRLGDARRQLLILHRTRRFSAEYLPSSDSQHGKDGHGKDHHAHPSYPLQQCAPYVDGRRQAVEPDKHSRSGRGHGGRCLEIRVRERKARYAEEQRQRGVSRKRRPGQRHEEEPVLRLQLGPGAPGEHPQYRADSQRQHRRYVVRARGRI